MGYIQILAPDGARVPLGQMYVPVLWSAAKVLDGHIDGQVLKPVTGVQGSTGYYSVPIASLGEHTLTIVGMDEEGHGSQVGDSCKIFGVEGAGYPFIEILDPAVAVVTPSTSLSQLRVHVNDYGDPGMRMIKSVECLLPDGSSLPFSGAAGNRLLHDQVWEGRNIPLTQAHISHKEVDVSLRITCTTTTLTTSMAKSATLPVPIKVVDQDPPRLTSVEIQQGNHLTGTAEEGAVATIKAVATDSVEGHVSTGISRVEYCLDGGVWVSASRSGPGGDPETWTADVHISAFGDHELSVRCEDGAGNWSDVDKQPVDVAVELGFSDVTRQDYLQDLMAFACARLTTDGGNSPTADQVGHELCQPYQALWNQANASQCRAPLPELRAVADVLARAVGVTWPRDPAVMARVQADAGIRGWLAGAYEAMLRALGTSAEELRRSRGMPQADRVALAGRLGFALGTGWRRPGPTAPSRPDPLDQLLLLLDGPVTEAQLRTLGTSAEELRRSRGMPQADRITLASRLGFALGPGSAPPKRPDRLDQLLLLGDAVTEDKLAELFGFPRLASWPDAPPQAGPCLLAWRLEWLRNLWRTEDHPSPDPALALASTPPPVVDPDIVEDADISSAAASQPIRDLRVRRVAQLGAEAADIRRIRHLAPAHAADARAVAVFDQTVRATLPDAHLEETGTGWTQQEAAGQSIDGSLAAAGLTHAAFARLAALRGVAASGPLTDDEWNEVDAILLRVRKLRLFDRWRAEESTVDIQLDPGKFVARPDFVAVPQWRALQQERTAWQNRLTGRDQQQQTVRDALAASVSSADAASLPLLRDALLHLCDQQHGADWRPGLHIDPQISPQPLTTRLDFAIGALHSVLLAARTGTLSTDPGPLQGWQLKIDKKYDAAAFDTEWEWMRSYESWLAAMSVFLRPENVLLPGLLQVADKTGAASLLGQFCDTLKVSAPFHNLCVVLRNAENTDLPAAVSTYLNDLRDLLEPNIPDKLKETWNYPAGGSASERADYAKRSNPLKPGDPAWLTMAPAWYLEVFLFVPLQIALTLQKAGQYLAALDWYSLLVGNGLPPFPFAGFAYDKKDQPPWVARKLQWLLGGLDPHLFAAEIFPPETPSPPGPGVPARPNAYLRFTLLSLARCLNQYADAQFTDDTSVSRALARDLYELALRVLAAPELTDYKDKDGGRKIPGNPLPGLLRAHAQLSLDKLRQGRNIAGLERPPDPPPVEQLTIPSDGLTAPPVSQSARPMPYHYQMLLQRARDLVSSTSQLEAAYLAALERRDAAAYDLLKAGQDLELAGAQVTVADAQTQIADQEVDLSILQTGRASIQQQTYGDWLDEGLNKYEQDLLTAYTQQRDSRDFMAHLDLQIAMASYMSGGAFGALAAVAAAEPLFSKLSVTQDLNATELQIQQSSLYASKERREDEWRLQKALAGQDVLIGQQQTAIARSRRNVASLEAQISRVQQQHASATLTFLATKFMGEELYEWMAGVLGEAYRYLLQQATAIAQMAQRQLYFERQEPVPACIKTDYWTVTSDSYGTASDNGSQVPDRRGLTGSARLLRDLTELDQHAFTTNRRRLQLSHPLSLAQLMPVEFARFRQTGVLPFATPMELFDRAFPGHYARLIHGVRLSFVGLIPPIPGVRATLTASGISRVVTGGDSYQTQAIRRDPEMIALSGAPSGTGVFDLDPQADLLRPFENMGVDTSWELRLPRDVNTFDFQALADVIITIDYTALSSEDYRQQVLRALPASLVGEAGFQLSSDFPDQWYDLVNAPPGADITVRLPITRGYFPPNAITLAVKHVALYMMAPDSVGTKLQVTSLVLNAPRGPSRQGGSATTVDRIITTRNSSGASWVSLTDPGWGSPSGPVGEWTLTLPGDAATRALIAQLDDLVLSITFEATLPTGAS